MHRPVSPLLHDYKPSAEKKPEKSKALQWFVVGLGIPLAGLALVSVLSTTTPVTPPPQEPILTAADSIGAATETTVEGPTVTQAKTFLGWLKRNMFPIFQQSFHLETKAAVFSGHPADPRTWPTSPSSNGLEGFNRSGAAAP